MKHATSIVSSAIWLRERDEKGCASGRDGDEDASEGFFVGLRVLPAIGVGFAACFDAKGVLFVVVCGDTGEFAADLCVCALCGHGLLGGLCGDGHGLVDGLTAVNVHRYRSLAAPWSPRDRSVLDEG
jgi:hypothetical protein